MQFAFTTLSLLALLLSPAAGAGTIYKCRNAQGTLLYQEKPCAEETQALTSWTPSNSKSDVEGSASFVIGQGNNGHYFVDGTINDHFLNFVIDTGATTVAIPQADATAAGLKCIKKGMSNTANGLTSVCTTKIQTFKFGGFTLNDVDAIIAPNLGKPLLGMNVLKRFRVEHENDQMRLTKKY